MDSFCRRKWQHPSFDRCEDGLSPVNYIELSISIRIKKRETMADANNGEDGKNTGAAKGGNDKWGRKRGVESPTPRDPLATNGIDKKNWVAKGDNEGQGRGRGTDSKKYDTNRPSRQRRARTLG